MVDLIQHKYAFAISSRLEKFSVKDTNPYRINMRCPICGDSKKSKSKSRGWLLEKNNEFFYFCHNCNASLPFSKFLNKVDQNLYNDFLTERYISNIKDKPPEVQVQKKKEEPEHIKKLSIKKISQLPHDHKAKQYIVNRKIPSDQHYRIFYVEKFMEWANTIIPNKFEDITVDEPRLVLPFKDKEGTIFGVSARSMKSSGLRYITLMFEERPKIFGLDKVNLEEPYLIVEGPIDSLFLSNAIAMAGADGSLHNLPPDNATFVFDNEKRNLELHKLMSKVISRGYKICIWPSHIKEKDINDMILKGMTQKEIENIIEESTYRGLQAEFQLNEWKKR